MLLNHFPLFYTYTASCRTNSSQRILQEFDGKFDEVPFHGNRYAAQAKPRMLYAAYAMVSCLDHAVGKL